MLRISQMALGLGGALLMLGSAQAAQHDIELHQVNAQGTGDSVGSVTLEDTDYGQPSLRLHRLACHPA